jgi:hypothetical protein
MFYVFLNTLWITIIIGTIYADFLTLMNAKNLSVKEVVPLDPQIQVYIISCIYIVFLLGRILYHIARPIYSFWTNTYIWMGSFYLLFMQLWVLVHQNPAGLVIRIFIRFAEIVGAMMFIRNLNLIGS